MRVKATYFQNNLENPLVYGDVELKNPPRVRLRGEAEKMGILAQTVFAGFCGTDYELMRMGQRGELTAKFPAGADRLVNGHEGLVWVPSENRFAIVLIRGGNSYDPTRFTEEESYFEYGCDGADGLFSDSNYYHPDMLLRVPDGYVQDGKMALSMAKRLVFADPYACMIFQRERMEDLGEAHNFRVKMAQYHCTEEEGRRIAREETFTRVCVFGLGTTGMFIGDLIRQKYPQAKIVFVGRSEENSPKVAFALEKAGAEYVKNNFETQQELADVIVTKLGGTATVFVGASGTNLDPEIAFHYGVLGCNGIYNSFSLGPVVQYQTMPFGFKNHLIFGSINFRRDHMEEAIRILEHSDYDRIVELIGREEFVADPIFAYEKKIFSKGAPLKTAVIWNEDYIDPAR
ncbi:MAG: hypothetical protein IKY59_07225 [Oscillospiraceae bacterium]|nr:hypothetical protein [Oscillospiraceae bacterium]